MLRPRTRAFLLAELLAIASLLSASAALAQDQPSFLTFESGQVRPLALSPDGAQLFAVNTPDNQLEIFDLDANGELARAGVVQVGVEPVAVAARTNDEVWVVNHLSDSVSVVDLSGSVPRVVRTLLVGDEPNDIVFAGPKDANDFFERAFITTAHRGQNSPYPQGEYDQEGIGRADVWVFDATSLGSSLGGDEIAIISLFGDKARALAATSDGSRVYAAVFRSGNQTTTLNTAFICETSNGNMNSNKVQGPCSVAGTTSPGGYPTPHQNQQDIDRPETGLIVKFNRDGGSSDHWQDEVLVGEPPEPRNWNDFVKFDLPDRDVFEINAASTPPAAIDGSASCANGAGCWAHVGTSLFNMVVHPSGRIYVSNTDARNHVRFEGPGTLAASVKPAGEPPTVQGDLARARITVLDGPDVLPRHLNKHLDYSARPAPASDKAKSLATPLGMAFSPDANTLYVAAFGSKKIGVFSTSEIDNDTFTPSATDHIQLSGAGGPSGLVVQGDRIYVLTRFDDSVKVIDRSSKTELQTLALHDPEPPSVILGRPFLYDAVETSSNGEASCSSCHLFGDMDDLAWDLGNPDDDQKPNNNGFVPLAGLDHCGLLPCVFHPMKGPMTTQSLRGLENMGPQHWRGDREGDAEFSFNAFNVAFPNLVGRDSEITTAQMQAFTDFALQIRYPPNPIRRLDNSLRADEAAGQVLYGEPATDIVASCNDCHTISASQGFFGSAGLSTFDGETQHFKVPHLRNVYQKIGKFGEAEPDPVELPQIPGFFILPFDGPYDHTGPQIRGFGLLHDGSIDTPFRFLSSGLFQLTNTEQSQLEAFVMAFPTDLAPIVGQQVTRTSASGLDVDARIDLMVERAKTPFTSKTLGGEVTECDLIAKVVEAGRQHGYLYVGEVDGLDWFKPDTGGASITDATLRGKATTAGQEVTFTCAPPGSGNRMGIDRVDDVLPDGVETNSGEYVDFSATGTDPALADTDGDGWDDGEEVYTWGSDPTDPLDYPGAPPPSVPSLSPTGLGVLAGLLMLAAGCTMRMPRTRPR